MIAIAAAHSRRQSAPRRDNWPSERTLPPKVFLSASKSKFEACFQMVNVEYYNG